MHHRIRPEFFPQAVMRALRDQMQIEVAQHGRKGIRVIVKGRVSGMQKGAHLVRKRFVAVAEHRFEATVPRRVFARRHAVGMLDGHRAEGGVEHADERPAALVRRHGLKAQA